jgi:hypothetical protein
MRHPTAAERPGTAQGGYELGLGGQADEPNGGTPPRVPPSRWQSWMTSPTGVEDVWTTTINAPVLRVA